jgi:LPXTG-motif cell wall-anchored protein
VIVLLVVVGATLMGVAYVIVRKRRNAELAKMKYLQQPR